ncbi:glutathione S-transferase 1-1-like [Myzus persicae]|uniref:glutathione S-transferase 1-1-like n=1 Tax=Myzus persicae TaxID=13164 RepID=UPI000B938A78|nr:glutathione S-transferase 1-1-like [Myzus persicae]
MTAKALNIYGNIEIKELILFKKQHKNLPELTKINSRNTLPTMAVKEIGEDEGVDYSLWDSHAIVVYLAQKYGSINNPLFPSGSIEIQGQINEWLHFDNGTLYPAFKKQYNPWLFDNEPKTVDNKDLTDALEFLEKSLKPEFKFVIGNEPTLADIALVASISTFEVAGVELTKYNKIIKWLTHCKELYIYKTINIKGLAKIEGLVKLRKADEKVETEST